MIACFMLLWTAAQLPAQTGKNIKVVKSIHGQVTDAETLKPVSGATIEMVCQECGNGQKGIKATAVSDDNGFYSIKQFVCGQECVSFAVSARATNYMEDLRFSSKWLDENLVLNFSLFSAGIQTPKNPLASRIRAKLLMGEKKKIPLANQQVNLLDSQEALLQSTVTDEFGDFSFSITDANAGNTIEIESNAALKDQKIYLARPNGLILGSFKAGTTGTFRYKILPAELASLSAIEAEDVSLSLGDFLTSKKKEITVMDNLYYESGKWAITSEAAAHLDKVVAILKKNPELKLDVYSHTDSRGDAKINMNLSSKRASSAVGYLVGAGIPAKRLSGKGFGESRVLNRCTEDVLCSEEEHKLNRRTEFRFKKP